MHYPGAEALSEHFPLHIESVGHEFALPANEMLDALRERGPLLARDLEVAPEIEHGTLVHALLDAHRLDQAMGVVGLARGARFDGSAPDVHRPATLGREVVEVNTLEYDYGTTLHPQKSTH